MEIIKGMQQILHIIMSREEVSMLVNYLDQDKSGDVNFREFSSKITLDRMHENSYKYRISEFRFIEFVLSVWYDYRAVQFKEITKKVMDFDASGDSMMQFDEFQTFLSTLEKDVDKKVTLNLFKEAIALSEDGENEVDAIDPKNMARLVMKYKIGGYGKEFFSGYLAK